VHFAPLKPRFLEVYSASRTFLPASAGLPSLVNYVRRTVEETDPRNVLPIIPRDLEFLATNDLQKGYDSMKTNKLDDGLRIFRGILHAVLLNAVSSEAEVAEAQKLITSASEYALAMKIELARRQLGTNEQVNSDPAKLKRSLELAAYFTIPKIEVPHRQLALLNAMNLASRAKNYNSALSFANRILANGGAAKILESVCLPLSLSPSLPPLHDIHFLSRNDWLTIDCLNRRARPKRQQSATPMTQSRSSSTSSPSSRSVLQALLRSTRARASRRAPSTAASTMLSTRARFALSAACVRWARRGVG
jgi:hypothetical protein